MSAAANSGKVVLVSGINGYIASRIGYDLLEKGYTLRGTSRSQHSADALINGAYKEHRQKVQMVAVPDMTIPGAFDEAVKGVSAIIHTASPISFQLKTRDDFVVPAVQGMLGMLESASRHAGPQLESVVLTSSVASIWDPSKTSYTFTEADWNTWAEVKAKELGDNSPSSILYSLSKVSSEKAFWKYRDDNKPRFSMSAVNPSVVVGPPVQPPASASALNETLKPIWGLFSGEMQTVPPGIGSNGYIDVRDVSAMHVWCMENPTQSANQRYMVAEGRATPQAAADILRKAYPDRKMIPVGNPESDYEPGYGFAKGGVSLSSVKAKKAVGHNFIKYDQSILETAKVFERYL